MALDDALNYERAESLDPVSKELATRRDRAASLTAVVSDAGVRQAADNVYETWGSWVSGELDSMINERENGMDAQRVIDSREAFAQAVRNCLEALNAREAASFKPDQ